MNKFNLGDYVYIRNRPYSEGLVTAVCTVEGRQSYWYQINYGDAVWEEYYLVPMPGTLSTPRALSNRVEVGDEV